jgi:RNase H-fold protein (predicted Holliday junction resolvase)
MNSRVDMPSKTATDSRVRIETLIALIDELIAVVSAENLELAQGLPASRSKQIARKTELAEAFEKWVKEISAQKISVQTSDERLRSIFAERLQQLQAAMDENIVGLRAAIAASKRRIDAVMSVIREQVADRNPYTSSGRLSSRFASTGTNVRA